jgi:hypothetical protein
MTTSDRRIPYEHRLRSVGSSLDSGGYHSVAIIEVDGGLIVSASAPGSRTPEVLEIPDESVVHIAQPAQMRGGVPHRLFSQGYKGFLAALGRRLDYSEAAAVAIVEGTDFVTVGGIRPVADDEDEMTYEPLDILLLAEDIQTIMLEVDSRAASQNVPIAPSGPAQPEPRSSRFDSVTSRVVGVVDSALRMVSAGDHPARLRN